MSDTRKCTCHPDDIGPPCEQKYALTECRIARLERERNELLAMLFNAVDRIGHTAPSSDCFKCKALVLAHGIRRRARAILEAKP